MLISLLQPHLAHLVLCQRQACLPCRRPVSVAEASPVAGPRLARCPCQLQHDECDAELPAQPLRDVHVHTYGRIHTGRLHCRLHWPE